MSMSTRTQLDQDAFRILLYRNDATELLVETPSDGLSIPAVQVPAHTRVAEEITAAIKSTWNLETVCLFTFPPGDPTRTPFRYQVVESCRPEAIPPAGTQWLPVASLLIDAFDDSGDFAAIQNSLIAFDRYRRGELPGVFGKPAWLRTITDWVRAHATEAGLSVTGEFRQVNACPTFSLIRFETDGPALWFKAVGDPNLHEYRITLKLASVFPRFLPYILASQPEWNAWLALESAGRQLGTDSNAGTWAAAAENLALLQTSSFGRRFELINAGCKDLRPCCLADLVEPLVDTMAKLMDQQTKLSPRPLSRQEVLLLGRDIALALREFGECAIPDTLGHLDMNPGNLLVWGTRCVFLDWAEAYVGPPLFSFQYLL